MARMLDPIPPGQAEGVIRRELAREVRTQPVEIIDSRNSENGTVGVFLTDYPNIHKGTTDRFDRIGWRLSGITQDGTEEKTVNLYFRPNDDLAD